VGPITSDEWISLICSDLGSDWCFRWRILNGFRYNLGFTEGHCRGESLRRKCWLSMQNGKLKEMAFNLLLFQVRVIITFWPRTEAFTAVVVASHGDFSFSSIEQWKL